MRSYAMRIIEKKTQISSGYPEMTTNNASRISHESQSDKFGCYFNGK